MVVTRWDPFRELATLQNRVNSLFQDYGRPGQDELTTTSSFVPAVDVYEDEHKVTLKLEIPGIKQEDVDIRLENNTLTVRGERNFEKEEKEENFHRIERRYGSFARSFTLPNTLDTDSVNASYENGVLRIELAKRAEAKPKQIKVNIGGSKSLGKTVEGTKAESKSTAA
ncbi:MAG TPA: Hsp20/alpha crystallin family protein [Terriglobales bacterium]|jgi:HSP20 family protein|nr:Hsp20/alpha crystallin family protein [Terriglobales bacterium]